MNNISSVSYIPKPGLIYTDDELNEMLSHMNKLSGGYINPVAFNNYYGTCFIDSTLNSIINSDKLLETFWNELPECIKNNEFIYKEGLNIDETITIDTVFYNGISNTNRILSCYDLKDTRNDYFETVYRVLLSIFVHSIGNSSEMLSVCIRVYLMFLENIPRISQCGLFTMKSMSLDMSFNEFLKNLDYNFCMYYAILYHNSRNQSAQNEIERFRTCTINYSAGVPDHELLNHLGIGSYLSDYNENMIMNVLNNCSNTYDIFIAMYGYVKHSNRKKALDECFKVNHPKYILTDMVLSKYSTNPDMSRYSPEHAIYYNIKDNIAQDNNKQYTLYIDDIDNTYTASILHFQMR